MTDQETDRTRVGVTVTWGTKADNEAIPGIISDVAVSTIVDYVNAIRPGASLTPSRVLDVFMCAVNATRPAQAVTYFALDMTIDGERVDPDSPEVPINGNPQRPFFACDRSVHVKPLIEALA